MRLVHLLAFAAGLFCLGAVPAARTPGPASPKPAPRSTASATITVDAWQADVRHVLQLLADVAGKNVVIDDEVAGRITVKLARVPWRDAWISVVRTGELGYIDDGNVLFVAPAEKLLARAASDDGLLESLRR